MISSQLPGREPRIGVSRATMACRWIGAAMISGVVLFSAGSAGAESVAIARVKNIDGTVHVERDGRRIQLAAGDRLMRGDRIETGPAAALGMAFSDSTMLSLGPDTRIVLREYAFTPAEGRFSFVLEMAQGTLAYISGLIAKLMPDAVRIETPASTVAVRGTRFLARVDPAR